MNRELLNQFSDEELIQHLKRHGGDFAAFYKFNIKDGIVPSDSRHILIKRKGQYWIESAAYEKDLEVFFVTSTVVGNKMLPIKHVEYWMEPYPFRKHNKAQYIRI